MEAPDPRSNPDPAPQFQRPSVARIFLVVAALSIALSLVFVAVVGGRGMRKHRFEASISTRANPDSLLAAILDAEAVGSIAGEFPGYGRLISITWDGPPRLGAEVTETYEHGTQRYRITDFDPPWLLEERYELEDDPRFAVVEQRWRIWEAEERRFELRNVLYPRNILGGFALELAAGQESQRELLVGKLRELEKWALAHPVETTSVALSKAQLRGASP